MNKALKWKLIVGFVLVFLAGGMTGAFVAESHARRVFFGPHERGFLSQKMRERLQTHLNLTPEQSAKISPIVDKAATDLQQIRKETGRRVRETVKEAHAQIATNLTDEQRARFQQMEARRRQHRFHGRRRPPVEEGRP